MVVDGEFNLRGRRLARNMALLSLAFLATDSMLAMIRFGNFGLQSGWYYAFSLACIGLLMMSARKDAEKSIKEMKHSSNVFVKGSIYSLFGLVLVFEFVAKLVFPIIERLASIVADSDTQQQTTNNPNWNTMGTFGDYGHNEHMTDYMMGARDDPPTGWH